MTSADEGTGTVERGQKRASTSSTATSERDERQNKMFATNAVDATDVASVVTSTGEPVAVSNAALEIEALYREFGEAIYRVARSVVRDASLAEDIVQETLLKAWQHRDDWRGDAPLRHWILRIAHNTAVSVLRKRREELRDPDVLAASSSDSGGPDVERRVAGSMAVDELWKVLDGLDPTTRAIVVLREVEGLAYEEIGEVLGLALPTVKTRLFRARRALSERMEGWR